MQNKSNNGPSNGNSPSLNGSTNGSSSAQQGQEFLSMLWPYSQLFSPQYFTSQPPRPPTAMAYTTIPIYCPAKTHPIDNAIHFANSNLIRNSADQNPTSNGNNNMTIQIGLQCVNQGNSNSPEISPGFRNKNFCAKVLNGAAEDDLKKGDNKLFEFTKLAIHGCDLAEKVAKNHKYRPCFKKIDSLCARLKQDISRPDGVLNNLNSQGMAWAVKDFIFVFTRIINAWFILKGYVYNSSDGMKKVQAAFTSEFQQCFFAWQEITQHLIAAIIDSFENLDEVVQKSRTNGGGSVTTLINNNGGKTAGVQQQGATANGIGNNLGGGKHQNLDLSHLYLIDNPHNLYNQFKEPKNEDIPDCGGALSSSDGYNSVGLSNSSSPATTSLPTPIYNEAERDEFETYYKTGLYQSVQRKPEVEMAADKDFLNSMDIVNLFRDNRPEPEIKLPFNGGTGETITNGNEHPEIDLIDKLILENNLKTYENETKESIPYILSKIREIKEASYFFSSVFMKNYFPGFEKIIKEIKDLRTIMIDAEKGRYANVYDLMTDLQQIIKSCRQYLKVHPQQHLQELVNTFQSEIDIIFPAMIVFDEVPN